MTLKKKLSPNGENWSMEKFENFCLQKWIFAVFAFFSTVFAVFRPFNTESIALAIFPTRLPYIFKML
jgi:hypothetical protein